MVMMWQVCCSLMQSSNAARVEDFPEALRAGHQHDAFAQRTDLRQMRRQLK